MLWGSGQIIGDFNTNIVSTQLYVSTLEFFRTIQIICNRHTAVGNLGILVVMVRSQSKLQSGLRNRPNTSERQVMILRAKPHSSFCSKNAIYNTNFTILWGMHFFFKHKARITSRQSHQPSISKRLTHNDMHFKT